ncbi:biogenesis of lysosome-related organelles complex 1 subunit 4-like [Trichechus inunguis]
MDSGRYRSAGLCLGLVEEPETPGPAWSGESGTVSQSHSSTSGQPPRCGAATPGWTYQGLRKMIGGSGVRLEEQVTGAKADLGTFPNTFKKFLHTIIVPCFNKASSTRHQSSGYEPPILFWTEDHFPCCSERPQN